MTENVYLIPFTQYLLPDGRKKFIEFECENEEVYNKAKELLSLGYSFDAEILSTGIVSFTCLKDNEDDEIIGITLAENDKDVIRAVYELINDVYARGRK
jgi:hypothetical protein